MTPGEKAEEADADETTRKRVEQEAAQRLLDRQRQESLLVLVRPVSPAERNLTISERHQAVVGDRDPS
jgi:hypothetical protein